jgi:hypothetical protein
LAFFRFLVDIEYGADVKAVLSTSGNPPDSVISCVVRPFSPFLCVLLILTGWGTAAIYAQSDTKNSQNRVARDTRNAPPSSPAAQMMREMQASLQKLPWNEFSPAVQARIRSVVSGAPIFHRMPQQTVYADSEIYNFLLRHPDVVIGFWEHLGATQLSLWETKENQYVLKETAGTAAHVEVLYRSNNLCIIYAKGEYRGPLLAKAYQGDVLLVLRTQFIRDETNEPMVVCDLDTWVQINSLGADVLAKLFFASLTKVVEGNFEVTVSFVGQVSKAAVRNAVALKSTAEEIPSIRQDVCVEFCDVVDRAAVRFARRNQPTHLTFAQQQAPPGALPETDGQDLRSFTKPPTEWEMDHFVDSPQPPLGMMHRESDGALNIPKSLDSHSTGYVVPKLPKQEK